MPLMTSSRGTTTLLRMMRSDVARDALRCADPLFFRCVIIIPSQRPRSTRPSAELQAAGSRKPASTAGSSAMGASRLGRRLKTAYADLERVRRQRVQMLRRYQLPFTKTRWFCTFGLNVRLFFGALSIQRPECWCRMWRPNWVVFAQTSQAPLAMRSQFLTCENRGLPMVARASRNNQTCSWRGCDRVAR